MIKEKMDIFYCSENFSYLIDTVYPAFKLKNYVPGATFPGLNIKLSTFKNARDGRSFSETTRKQVAGAFTLFLKHPERGRITPEDLSEDPETFKGRFPQSAFVMMNEESHLIHMNLFAGKLYRGYYLARNMPYRAYMAYLKLFESNGRYKARMIRGIQDFALAAIFRDNFDTPEHLEDSYRDFLAIPDKDKKTESMHLYKADEQDVRISKNCIRIDFRSEEEDPCYCTVYWNVCHANRSAIPSYIGGSALVVDTNDGKRGRDICAFKMGLETVENTGNRKYSDDGPLNAASSYVIQELTPEIRNGVMIMDNADDDRWFRFIRANVHRGESDEFKDVNVSELVYDLLTLRAAYSKELGNLRQQIRELKAETSVYDDMNGER